MNDALARIEGLEHRLFLSGESNIAPLAGPAGSSLPAKIVERLNRGLVAVSRSSTSVYLSWRLLGNESTSLSFNVYRSANSGAFVKRNANPITTTTDYIDTGTAAGTTYAYYVRPIINGVEQSPSETYTLVTASGAQQYLNVPLQVPAGGTTPDGVAYTYSANDCSVGDVDGDGQYEIIVKWDPSNSKDNSQSGYTGNVYLDAYTLSGTRLWRIDLGINIRAGAHYTQFMVYDLDSDGKAEVACKTAPGTKDGLGNNVILGSDDPSADYRNTGGYILSGPEYLTVFNGLTGAAMSTVNYIVPRGTVSSWGDSYGNRVDRFLATIAYLDGVHPSLVMCRGYYTRATLAAWDFRNGQLSQRWLFDSNNTGNSAYAGMGTHNISTGDVDGDGKDEIVYGACTIDDNGTGLYSTGLGHGDALHVSDMILSRPGLEVFQIHESQSLHQGKGGTLRDGATGEVISFVPGSGDVGRGVAFDIDPRYDGYEMWTSADAGLYNADGTYIQDRGNAFYNFGIWWDADPLRELLDGTTIADWKITNGVGGRSNYVFAPANVTSNNSTKSTPCLSGDIIGDWREEVVWRTSDSSALQIWTTTIAATSKTFTLMHDPQYRVSIAWQNTAYNQPPHTGFFLGAAESTGTQMPTIPAPNIIFPGGMVTDIYQSEAASFGAGSVFEATNGGFNSTGYINFNTTGGFLQFDNVDGGTGATTSIVLRYALGATSARTGTISINGVSQNITFAPTGSWTSWALMTLSSPLTAGATNTIRLQSTGQDLANIDELQLTIMDLTAPTIVSGSHDIDAHKISVVFSEDVSASVGASDFTIQPAGGGASFAPAAVSYSATTRTATVSLPSNLADDNYVLTISGIVDRAGNSLTGANTIAFWFLNGDANRNRKVDTQDFNLLAGRFGQSSSVFSQGDFDFSGTVDSIDFAILVSQFGKTLATPAPIAGARLFGDELDSIV
jgi:rhamnogalacturonan endolyase